MPSRELTIYCDESATSGKYYSDFYGGALVGSDHIDEVKERISAKKAELNLYGEVKWTKITENYADKYIALIDLIFDLIAENKMKVRIMFTQNMFKAKGLTQEHKDNKYIILYYQFIKHAFGLKHLRPLDDLRSIRVYLDKMPDTVANVEAFRNRICSLPTLVDFMSANLVVRRENVTEVRSHDHDILQCLDIILGAMNFRLNNLYKEKPLGKARRGKRTIAKERVYKHINKRICEIYPRFNIGVSTGMSSLRATWVHPYRLWCFRSTNHTVVEGGSKRKSERPRSGYVNIPSRN